MDNANPLSGSQRIGLLHGLTQRLAQRGTFRPDQLADSLTLHMLQWETVLPTMAGSSSDIPILNNHPEGKCTPLAGPNQRSFARCP